MSRSLSGSQYPPPARSEPAPLMRVLAQRLRERLPRKEAVFLVCLAVLGLAGFALVDRLQRDDLQAREERTLQENRLALRGADQTVRRMLEAVATLHDIAAFYWLSTTNDPGFDHTALERLLRQATSASPFGIFQVAVTDATGLMLWSTVPGYSVTDLADREHIRSVLQGHPGLFLGTPVVGRVSGKPTVNMTRAIRDAEGRVVGVSVVSVDPLGLSDDLAQQFGASGAVVTVLREDGTIMARSLDPRGFIGTKLPESLTRRFTASDRGDSVEAVSREGRRVFASWRQVAGSPLWLFFGEPAAPLLRANAEYGQRLRITLALVVFGIGTTGLLAINLGRQRRQRADAAKVEARSREMTELVEALPGVAYRGMVMPYGDAVEPHLALPLARVLAGKVPPAGELPPLEEMLDEAGIESRADLARQVRAEGQGSTEYRISAPGIGAHWVREQCRVLRRSHDGTAEVVGLLTDITREREIAANALTSSKMATLGEMATGIAHELNQPCAIIGIATEVALMEMDKGATSDLASARGRLDEVLTQTDRMRRIINHLRAFARPESSAEEPIALSAAVEGALGIATGVLRDHGVRVVQELPADLPKVRARLVPLEQVLVNLLLNARDAMADLPAGAREIRIDGGVDPEHPSMVRLSLRDHGHGIAPDILPRVFEPFFTTRPVGKGTGLGLSIAYGTVQASGGMIELSNHPDGGVLATIWLQKA